MPVASPDEAAAMIGDWSNVMRPGTHLLGVSVENGIVTINVASEDSTRVYWRDTQMTRPCPTWCPDRSVSSMTKGTRLGDRLRPGSLHARFPRWRELPSVRRKSSSSSTANRGREPRRGDETETGAGGAALRTGRATRDDYQQKERSSLGQARGRARNQVPGPQE